MNPVMFCSIPSSMKKALTLSSASVESTSVPCLSLHVFSILCNTSLALSSVTLLRLLICPCALLLLMNSSAFCYWKTIHYNSINGIAFEHGLNIAQDLLFVIAKLYFITMNGISF